MVFLFASISIVFYRFRSGDTLFPLNQYRFLSPSIFYSLTQFMFEAIVSSDAWTNSNHKFYHKWNFKLRGKHVANQDQDSIQQDKYQTWEQKSTWNLTRKRVDRHSRALRHFNLLFFSVNSSIQAGETPVIVLSRAMRCFPRPKTTYRAQLNCRFRFSKVKNLSTLIFALLDLFVWHQ